MGHCADRYGTRRPPVSEWTAKAASQDAMSLGPSVVNQVGPSSGVPFR